MTEQEQQAVLAATKIIARQCHDDGMRTAVEMIRMAAIQRSSISLLDLAAAIESTITPPPPTDP